MITDFFVALIASVAFFILGNITYYFYRKFKIIKPIEKLWKISDPKNLIICAATSTKTDTGKYLRPATGIGQIRALGYSIESLSKAYDIRIQNILLSEDQVQKQITNDIIILGGPKNNIIAQLFLDKFFQIKEIVEQKGNTIYWKIRNEEKEFNAIEVDQKVIKDYGLIIRGQNQFSNSFKRTSFCLFTGCHTYGTIAAAKYFTEDYVSTLTLFSKSKNNIVLLVECDIVDGFPVGVQIIKKYEF